MFGHGCCLWVWSNSKGGFDFSGSEKHWSVPRRKGKVPVVEQDAAKNEHDLELCWAYGNTFADSFFMEKCGNPIAVNPEGTLKKLATERDWPIFSWRV